MYYELGMSYDEYWHGSSIIFERYNILLEAQSKRKLEKLEFEAWLHGYYTYVAIGASLNGKQYPSEMYGMYHNPDEEVNDKVEDAKVKKSTQKEIDMKRSAALIHSMMSAANRGIKERK